MSISKKSISAIEVLNKHKGIVWSQINSYLKSPLYPDAFKVPSNYKQMEEFHWTLASEYPNRRGKYVRPTLLLLTALAMGQTVENALKTAAAMQLSEEWILISDDIEDGSLLRRGKPTLHKQYGIELAINASDTLQSVMWKVLFDNLNLLGIEKTNKLVTEFYSMIMRTELGQTTEIKWFTENKLDFNDEDWYFIGSSKSGYYSIAGPIRLGAIIAGASEEQLDLLSKFGIELGNCWQLVDDLLDLTSDFQGLKQKANDIYEGKRTVMLGHLLREANSTDRETLVSILNKNREAKTHNEVDWILNKMQEYGSINYGRSLAEKHKRNCVSIFDKDLIFLRDEPERTYLRTLIDFILERKH